MRQKADKLEKGKWYCDLDFDGNFKPTFLKYSHSDDTTDFSSELKGVDCYNKIDGFYPFFKGMDSFIPTPEDIEKYNLNETDNGKCIKNT